MTRVAVFIDGFNVYHALQEKLQWHKYKWLDYGALARCYLGGKETLAAIYLFTALATWNQEKVKRHRTYLRALEAGGIKVVVGKFKRKDSVCRAACKQPFHTFVEKLTDVNIAVQLFRGSYVDEYDKAILITGDTDILLAVKMAHDLFPTKRMGVVVPIGRQSEDLKCECDFHFRMKERHLQRCQLPEVVSSPHYGDLRRPESWK
jgi:uncharacterized LabA/DUF88 family protein